jgi:hypothetical protein
MKRLLSGKYRKITYFLDTLQNGCQPQNRAKSTLSLAKTSRIPNAEFVCLMNSSSSSTYRRLAKSKDGCNVIMSHGSANVFQAGDGGIPFTESMMPGDVDPCS